MNECFLCNTGSIAITTNLSPVLSHICPGTPPPHPKQRSKCWILTSLVTTAEGFSIHTHLQWRKFFLFTPRSLNSAVNVIRALIISCGLRYSGIWYLTRGYGLYRSISVYYNVINICMNISKELRKVARLISEFFVMFIISRQICKLHDRFSFAEYKF